MKKQIILLSSVLLLFSACTQTNEKKAKEDKLKVVTTIFPQYDFTREIAGDNVDLKMLLKPGTESHSFEPTPQDIKDIQEADLFIYVGGENDVWVDTILSSMEGNKPETIKLIDTVNTYEEEIIEGMQHEHHHEEIDEAQIKDRKLDDFTGIYTSITEYINQGLFDDVINEHAKEENEDYQEVKNEFLESFDTNYEAIEITEKSIILNTKEHLLTYDSYYVQKDDDGDTENVWYIFKSDSTPKYIAVNDHHIENHHSNHLHILFIDNLNEIENTKSIPFYISTTLNNEEISEMLTHNHHEIDEHVWTSPINAIKIVKTISEKLIEKDPKNVESYIKNTNIYIDKLHSLDQSFKDVVNNSPKDTIIFGDRFPFRYLAEEYDLDYYAAFTGCSNETEASAQTVAFLIDKTKEENIPVIFSIEMSNGKIADSIAEATGAKRLTLYSCHNLTKDELENGETYLSMMQKNVESLKEALK